MTILYLPRFAKEYKKLPRVIQVIAERKEMIFRENPFDKRLKTHKLHGELENFWAFSINLKYRIIFDFKDTQTVRFYRVGGHDIY